MSPRGIAALYGVVTFGLLAALYMVFVHLCFGWPYIPDVSRWQGSLMLGFYALAGYFSRVVGVHGARGATLGQAWEAGAGDVLRAIQSVIFR